MREELEKLIAEATPGPWGVWRERINGPEGAIRELTDQVRHTSPVGDELVMIDAGGKCPAITGCGPTSDANADLIVFLVNNAPAILEALTERASMAAEIERLRGIVRGWHYLAVGPDEMGDYYTHKQLIKLSEPYASPALKAIKEKNDVA